MASGSARSARSSSPTQGVDLNLDIEKDFDTIPADTLAVVGNRSAVGEQYVELQPQADTEPYLTDDSEIATENTRTPIKVETLLTNLSNTVESVDKKALKTTVTEMGKAFGGTGKDLGRIIDSGNSFIEQANENFDVTTALIRDSNTVLNGQLAKASAIRTFARNLQLFSSTLAGSDADLRRVIDSGSVTATELRSFIEDNEVQLGELVSRLVTTGEVVVKHLDGVEQVLVLYPYVVEGGFTVVSKSPGGRYDAHFGMILQQNPHVCNEGYNAHAARTPRPSATPAPRWTWTRTAPSPRPRATPAAPSTHRSAPERRTAHLWWRRTTPTPDASTGTTATARRTANPSRGPRPPATAASPGSGSLSGLWHDSCMAPDDTASGRSPRIRAALLAVLVVTTLASAGCWSGPSPPAGEAEEAQAQREEIMSVGEQFMLRKETFGPDDLDDQGRLADYDSSVGELITPKLSSSFEEQTRAIEQLVAKSGLESESDVYATAVTGSDDDSADAIVVGDTVFKFTRSQSETRSFRYNLTLVKTNGEWLVDSFEDVSGGQP